MPVVSTARLHLILANRRQDATYVLDTLYSLLITLSEEEKELVLLVVYVGDLDPAVANQTVQEVSNARYFPCHCRLDRIHT